MNLGTCRPRLLPFSVKIHALRSRVSLACRDVRQNLQGLTGPLTNLFAQITRARARVGMVLDTGKIDSGIA